MDKLESLIRELIDLKSKRDEYLEKIIQENAQVVLQLNTEDQLYNKGVTSSGQPVQPEYTARTIQIKKGKGQITSHVTLKDTGNFYKGFYLIYRGDGFSINSSDQKANYLSEKYKDIYGITPDSVSFISDQFIKPWLEHKLNEIKNGK